MSGGFFRYFSVVWKQEQQQRPPVAPPELTDQVGGSSIVDVPAVSPFRSSLDRVDPDPGSWLYDNILL